MPKIIGASGQLSQHINRRVTQSIFHAFDYAAAAGVGFNLYAVINLREDDEASMVRTFGFIRHKYRDWLAYLRKKGVTIAVPLYTCTMENPGGQHAHVNWVLHVPAHLVEAFRRKLPQWVERARGMPAGPFDIDVQEIEAGTEKSLAKYIVKGTNPAFIDHFHLQRVAAPARSRLGASGRDQHFPRPLRPRGRRLRQGAAALAARLSPAQPTGGVRNPVAQRSPRGSTSYGRSS